MKKSELLDRIIELRGELKGFHARITALEGPLPTIARPVPRPLGNIEVAPEPLGEIRVRDSHGDGFRIRPMTGNYSFFVDHIGLRQIEKDIIPDLIAALQKVWEARND